MRIAVIGAGLAGSSLAFALKRFGSEVIVFEASGDVASAASGNQVGLYNPRFTAERTPQSDYYVAAYSLAVRMFSAFTDIDWNPCGALHLITDEKREKRYAQTLENWRWEPEHMRLLNAQQASDVAGVELGYGALYLPDSGSVSPAKLCRSYLKGIEVRLNHEVEDLESLQREFDYVVLACAYGVKAFAPDLPLSQVRGQVSIVQQSHVSEKLKCALCYGGYMSPANDEGQHLVGSTFQRWLSHSDIIEQDDLDNLEKLGHFVPAIGRDLEVVGHRASVRTTVQDHFPIVGRLDHVVKNIYISTGHGSHGIISSLMAAELLSDMIYKRPLSLGRQSVKALSPYRFSQ
ncbi:MAG: hypothetical protein CMH26_05675 [Micavibrio sp.]|nr:hypothetical protein [Micavibrio sp.]|tara:strand:- start:855 stop:1895 length:1041 start_codon:yes stop_codon:yes gene_type:complete